MDATDKPKICLLTSAETSAGVLYGLYDTLNTVGAAYPDMISGIADEELLDVKIVAKSKEPFRCLSGPLIEPHLSLNEVQKTDAVVVCDMFTPIDTPPTNQYTEEVEWLKKMYANQALLTAVCSGSAVLAETGLLNGCEISGHWAYRHMFAKYYPEIKWREDAIINFSAVDKRLITTGGVTAWQDLVIYLIKHFCGLKHAIYTAKVHLLQTHSDGQLPFAAMTQRYQTSDAAILRCQTWIADNLNCANPVTQMIDQSGIKKRTFVRRFYTATNYQPLDYVQNLRIEAAKNSLETDSMNIDQIGLQVGYEDPASFRRLFKRKVGITPALYRKKFSQF